MDCLDKNKQLRCHNICKYKQRDSVRETVTYFHLHSRMAFSEGSDAPFLLLVLNNIIKQAINKQLRYNNSCKYKQRGPVRKSVQLYWYSAIHLRL